MNHLAHLFVADRAALSPLGTLLADTVRCDPPDELGPRLIAAIRWHRRVDTLTDRHPAFLRSKRRLDPRLGHFRAVLVDVFYDHVLARAWSRWSVEPLPAFCERTYAEIERELTSAPAHATGRVARLVAARGLARYATEEGVAFAVGRLAARLSRPVDERLALSELRAHRRDLGRDLDELLPDLLAGANRAGAAAAGLPPPG